MQIDRSALENVFANADCLYSLEETQNALDAMAKAITADLSDTHPIVLGVMNGAVATLGFLLPRLPFLLEVDYVHATRYQGERQGAELLWKRKPDLDFRGRQILLVDDILDRGITLGAIAEWCKDAGAADVKIAVLGVKQLADFTPLVTADFMALSLPDRYVFGFGMDYCAHWRNAPGIYAC